MKAKTLAPIDPEYPVARCQCECGARIDVLAETLGKANPVGTCHSCFATYALNADLTEIVEMLSEGLA